MSAAKTGLPAAAALSARSWSVFVLPVPVAPAMSPCRFSIATGSRTSTPVCDAAGSTKGRPMPIADPSKP
jgi:hypothetical protein